MRYKLFLDDERYPATNDEDWRIVRNYHDAVWYIRTYGIPYHISFDHDLSYEHYLHDWNDLHSKPKEFTGYDFAKWFCDYVLENDLDLPEGFCYYVHSMNPIGAENIRTYMENFLKEGYVK